MLRDFLLVSFIIYVQTHLLEGNILLLQEPGAIETEFADIGINKVLKYILTSLPVGPFYLSKGKALKGKNISLKNMGVGQV